MVINMRYFVTTIISIFLSLSIGIFIGALIDSQQLFIEQQKELVAQIEEEFDIFKEKNNQLIDKIEELEIENKRYNEFLKKMENFLILNIKNHSNVAFIKLYDKRDYSEITNLLKKTGIENIHEISINEINEDNLPNRIIEYFKNNFDKSQLNYIYDFKEKPDYVIITDGSFKESLKSVKDIKLKIIKLIEDLNIPVVVIDYNTPDLLDMSFYTENGVLSIEKIDSKHMKLALIMALKVKEYNQNGNE